MRATSIAAVVIAVSGLWLTTRFKGYDNATRVNAAAPGSYVENNSLAIGAAISNGFSFSPLRNDICDGGIDDSLSSIGIEGKPMLSAAPNAAWGKYQARGGVDADEQSHF